MSNLPALPALQDVLSTLHKENSPESQVILSYINDIRAKNIAVLGTDEAFVLQDSDGQIKAFKKALTLSENDGTLIKPAYNSPFVVSAQGYECWAEATGTSVIFPKEVLVGGEWRPNPYAERDPVNRRILAVHARAVSFKYSSMGIPQVSDWTTIFDTPSYRMIDLLAKAKKFPQCFKVLPSRMEPEVDEKSSRTWASYPFDESMNLWIDTSHSEVITWLSQILNREKKAMDFAQTFAKRNSLKHLSGIQKAPGGVWTLPVLAWRPTGNNIIKWDATQYAELQDRVSGMIEGGTGGFNNKPEIKKGSEKVSEEANFEALESSIDPEDNSNNKQESADKSQPVTNDSTVTQKQPSAEISKSGKQVRYLEGAFPSEYKKACQNLRVTECAEEFSDVVAQEICQEISNILDND